MRNVFMNKSAEELHIQLSDGRVMPLEDLVRDYERLLNEESTSEPKDDRQDVSKLKVGKFFRIDRNVIDENRDEIYRKCIEEGTVDEELWKRFEASNKIADENHDQYPRLIDVYIFEHSWNYKTEQEMRDMCKKVGEDMCDEIICDLELQMRICNGELVDDLVRKSDKIAKELGYHYSIVLGSQTYYSKRGYSPAINYGIKAPFEVPNENFMAIKLKNTDREIIGIVEYAKEFGI